MTTYDELWAAFLNKTKINDLDLPQTDQQIYDTIHNAVRAFNNRLQDNLSYDDATETFGRELTDNEILLLTHFIRLIILENQLIYFSNLWNPFTKEIGLKNFGDQLKRLETLVENESKRIDSIIINMADDYL